MPQPFAAETWVRRSTIPGIVLNGGYSGAVVGPVHAVYDPVKRVVQSFSIPCHHFQGFSNTSQISFDDGANWTPSFNAAADVDLNETCITGWSLPHPSIPGARIHFQIRVAWKKAFLVFDGSIVTPGGISLWVADGGSTFFKLQDLHTWPAINEIGGSGGAAAFDTNPNATPPILIEGSGPDGEDAYWFLTSYDFQAGGAGNRTHFKAVGMWRSLDGGITWENVRDLESEFGFVPNVIDLQRSTTGRLLLRNNLTIWYTDEADDLPTASWTQSIVNPGAGQGGNLLPMYGGTWFTFSQGTLIGAGVTGISCDDGTTFLVGGSAIVPINRGGYSVKLGPVEILHVAPGFTDPTTETTAYYSNNSGETFVESEPWLVSSTGELPVMLALRENGTPIVVCRGGAVYISGDKARGVIGTRTICPLANAGLAAARPLVICGHPLANNPCEDH